MSTELLNTINELLAVDGLPASDRIGLLQQKVTLMTTALPPVMAPKGQVTPPPDDDPCNTGLRPPAACEQAT